MKASDDFLLEIHTEELPPKTLKKLSTSLCEQIKERLQKNALPFKSIYPFATPRRLGVLVTDLVAKQEDQEVEKKGPAVAAAFDREGNPTPACKGFAQSCGVNPTDLIRIKSQQGEWVGFKQKVAGKSVKELLPKVVVQAAAALPIAKRMRWGNGETEFVRPVHSVILLYGDEIIAAEVLGVQAGRVTRGHRFLNPDWITIPHASTYASLLETEGFIIADFDQRQKKILNELKQATKKITNSAEILENPDLLDEVTGLVEWPIALIGQFDQAFLALPQEVLISAMEDHQRYFPLVDASHNIQPYFAAVSNIETHDMGRIRHGYERVLRARLADAAFFFEQDKKERLEARVERLKGIVYQAKLGTLYEKAERLRQLSAFLANKIKADGALAERAGWLAKTDLTTAMVGEFPELQGVMGYYYAQQDGENEAVALAIKEHYMPRFAGDELPTSALGQIVALAERIDLLVGAFGINQIPTGDKDPYGLRRAAIGIIRILIENNLNIDLQELIEFNVKLYRVPLANPELLTQLLTFIQERLRSWYLEQGYPPDVFAAVAALSIANPLDVDKRLKAVQAFKKLHEAEMLSVANKRVSNILAKYADVVESKGIDPKLFENSAEKRLAQQLDEKTAVVESLGRGGDYEAMLIKLSELREPIDDFFDQVMVMTDDKARRENRILLLKQLRALFLKVADIALLQ